MLSLTALKAAILSLPLLVSVAYAAADKPTGTQTESFPLPVIPADITDPARRASIAASRFWDGATLAPETDTVTPALEQAMADFAAIASMGAEPDSIGRGAEVLLRKGGADLIMPLAERYLYDPESPVRSEEALIRFLQLTPDRPRSAALLEQAMKNRPGTPAADFDYVDSHGRKSSLAAFAREHGGAFVYFFDSDCDVCKSMIPDAVLASGGKAVLAVCPAGCAVRFDETVALFPEGWTVARDLGRIEADDLYIFSALPSVYIIAPDMTVRDKDMKL